MKNEFICQFGIYGGPSIAKCINNATHFYYWPNTPATTATLTYTNHACFCHNHALSNLSEVSMQEYIVVSIMNS
jgi:hypothetical protein